MILQQGLVVLPLVISYYIAPKKYGTNLLPRIEDLFLIVPFLSNSLGEKSKESLDEEEFRLRFDLVQTLWHVML